MLLAENLRVAFGGVAALAGASLQVDDGEIVAVIGPNGAGKTTLLDALCGAAPLREGRVLLDGHDLAGLPPHRRVAAGLARTLQQATLYTPMSVADHLQLAAGVADAIRPVAASANANARLAAVASLVQLQADSPVRVDRLQAAERRRLDLAMALLMRPRCLLLDEPAAGAGPAETAILLTVLRRVRESFGIGIVLVEHDVALVARAADRVIVLDSGRLIADGAPADVLTREVVVTAYLGAAPAGAGR